MVTIAEIIEIIESGMVRAIRWLQQRGFIRPRVFIWPHGFIQARVSSTTRQRSIGDMTDHENNQHEQHCKQNHQQIARQHAHHHDHQSDHQPYQTQAPLTCDEAADLIDRIEDLHRRLSPSQAAYDVIHKHCEVIATLSWILARHRNHLRHADNAAANYEILQRSVARHGLANTGSHINVLLELPTELTHVHGGTPAPYRIDEALAYAGGLVHDIGTYQLLLNDGSDGQPVQFDGPRYVQHGLIGYQMLLDEGFSKSFAQFCRNHTGVGLHKSQVIRQNLPLPPADYLPLTLEQETVMVADKYNSKSIPPEFLTAQSYARKATKFGQDNAQRWMSLVGAYGTPNIAGLAALFGMRVRE